MGGRRRLPAISIALSLLVAAPGIAVSAETKIKLEAENYSASHVVGTRISTVSCGAASGGLAIEGFDEAGEWIEIPMQLADPMDCLSGVRSAGLTGVTRNYMVEIIPTAGQGTNPKDTLVTPPGSGIT